MDGDGGGEAFAPRPSSVGSFEAEGEIRGHLSEENSDYATAVGEAGRGGSFDVPAGTSPPREEDR